MLHYLSALVHWIGKGIAHPPGSASSEAAAGAPAGNAGAPAASVQPTEYSHASLALARLPGLAWSILADSYHTPLCVDYAPDHIAASILHLALRIAGVEVTGNRHSDMAWWQVHYSILSILVSFILADSTR